MIPLLESLPDYVFLLAPLALVGALWLAWQILKLLAFIVVGAAIISITLTGLASLVT